MHSWAPEAPGSPHSIRPNFKATSPQPLPSKEQISAWNCSCQNEGVCEKKHQSVSRFWGLNQLARQEGRREAVNTSLPSRETEAQRGKRKCPRGPLSLLSGMCPSFMSAASGKILGLRLGQSWGWEGVGVIFAIQDQKPSRLPCLSPPSQGGRKDQRGS